MRWLIAFGCVAVAAMTVVACYDPAFQQGLPCSVESECPEGHVCAADGKCYAPDDVPPDAGDEPAPDAGGESSPDAMVESSPDALDTTAPAPIADLLVETVTASSVELAWTSPGDDGQSGVAAGYDLRYSTSMITASNWASATMVSGIPAPQSAGRRESFSVSGLAANTTYYFAIKTEDDLANRSEISNVATTITGAPLPPSYVGTAASNTEIDGSDSVGLTYTVPAGGNRLLIVVAVAVDDSTCDPVAPSSVRYGGVGLTKLAQATKSTNAHVSMWYLVAPAVGSAPVVVRWSCAGGDYAAAAYSYVGVDQIAPFGPATANIGNGNTASVSVSSAPGELAVEATVFRFGPAGLPAAGTGQVPRLVMEGPEIDAGSVWSRTLASERPGQSSSTPMAWSVVESHHWAMVGASLKPALN